MPDLTLYDVAIIGAGPAGCSAAYTAAKEGLSAIFLEEHAKVGEPVHCGECLSLFATRRMGLDIPKEAIAQEVKGIRVVWPDGSSTIYSEPGYDLDKHVFEQYLAVRAQGAGARLQTSSRVSGMSRQNGIWTLTTPAGPVRARAVIDASGYESVSNKLTGLNEKRFSTVNGAQYLMEDVPNDGYIEFFIWPRLAPEGYLWIIPKRNGAANVGLVTPEAAKVHPYLKAFIKEKGLEGKKIVKPFGGIIPASGPLARTYADGLLLAGDAAGFTSPMFEGGTQLGLKSGELAALTLARAAHHPKPVAEDINTLSIHHDSGAPTVASDPFSANALSEYEHLWRAEFPPYEKLLAGKHRMYAFSETELNQIARIIPRNLTHMNWADKTLIAAKLALHPHLLQKGVLSALDTFSYSTGSQYGW
ncbi:MAG: NAD(P)/FAD-dependent oxidoreductase [Candidatus Micrarchaeota archaeon]|nr:NAD(P)/FAD-dependent oxidoreductase [Candidatus Micrarchaeota archaeon]